MRHSRELRRFLFSKIEHVSCHHQLKNIKENVSTSNLQNNCTYQTAINFQLQIKREKRIRNPKSEVINTIKILKFNINPKERKKERKKESESEIRKLKILI